MSIPSSWKIAALLGFIVAALLPWIGHRLRQTSKVRCALDGVDIQWMNVTVRSQPFGETQFCSISCAEKWLQASRVVPDRILVTDESQGTAHNASEVFFVRSQVVVHAPTRGRIHVFATRDRAQKHATTHQGRILEGTERPFAKWLDLQQTGNN